MLSSNGRIQEFVQSHNGNRVIEKILVASNGIAAVKGIRSIKKWAHKVFGNENTIQFVVMVTPEDIQGNAEYLRLANQFVEVPGGSNSNNYANVDLIVELAERFCVDAVWSGWGHASENPKLPEALARVTSRPIAFIGPSGAAMRALGDKVAASIVAQTANVPTLPWSGDGLRLPTSWKPTSSDVCIPPELYNQACVHSLEEGLEMANRIGYPIMIKSSEGGGGKGIRKVDVAEEFGRAYRQVCHEVAGSPVLLMKLGIHCRHLEVQVVADLYGQVISLFGRDCSVQRRHQKIIEEAPVTIAPAHLFKDMEAAALRLAQMVGYASAGTVEYLYDRAAEKYYFLEMNPRLQVEHPTTEMVSNVNLPAVQLQIAMGIPLRSIESLRPFVRHRTPLDGFPAAPPPQPRGHVMAARITAENPDAGFRPMSGQVKELNFRSSTHAWGYFSVIPTGGLHDYADSQFGHVFARGESRQEARMHLVMALKELSIRGDFRTIVEVLITLLESDDFQSNTFHTQWLDRLIARPLRCEPPDRFLTLLCAAMYSADRQFEQCLKRYTHALEKGQVLEREALQIRTRVDWVMDNVRYPFSIARIGWNDFLIALNGTEVLLEVRRLSDGGYLVALDSQSHIVYFKEEPNGLRLTLQGKTCMVYREVDASQLFSPSPGKLARWIVAEGAHVGAHQVYAEVEIMKMILSLTSSVSGVVTHVKPAGSVLAAGDLLGHIHLDDPEASHRATLCVDPLPSYGPPHSASTKPHHQVRAICHSLQQVLQGYAAPCRTWAETLGALKAALRHPRIFQLELLEALSSVAGKIPAALESQLRVQVSEGLLPVLESGGDTENTHGMDGGGLFRCRRSQMDVAAGGYVKCKASLEALIRDAVSAGDASAEEAVRREQWLAPFRTVLERYARGLRQHEMELVCSLFRQYLELERVFDHDPMHGRRFQSAVQELRRRSTDVSALVNSLLSHANLSEKNALILALMDEMMRHERPLPSGYMDLLKQCTQLSARIYTPVVLRAREILIESVLPSLETRLLDTEETLRAAIMTRDPPFMFDLKQLSRLVETHDAVYDILPTFFYHADALIRLAALEVYIRRSYQAYAVRHVVYHPASSSLEWHFDRSETLSEINRVPSISEHLSEEKEEREREGGELDEEKELDALEEEPSSTSMPLLGYRVGLMRTLARLQDVDLPSLLRAFKAILCERAGASIASFARDAKHVLMICIAQHATQESDVASELAALVRLHRPQMHDCGLRRLTFVVQKARGQFPSYWTFSQALHYEEQLEIRHIEPALAFQLELSRLSHFDIQLCPSDDSALHIYHAVGRQHSADTRFFVRALVRPQCLDLEKWTADYLINESDGLMEEILDALEVLQATHPNTDCNHLFFNVIPPLDVTLAQIQDAFRGFIIRHGRRLWRLRVSMGEVRLCLLVSAKTSPMLARLGVQTSQLLSDGEGAILPIRFTMSNVNGFSLKIHAYQECLEGSAPQQPGILLRSVFSTEQGPLDGQRLHVPYANKEWLQPKRYSAHLNGTTYVYDFPELFRQSLQRVWQDALQRPPQEELLQVNELALDVHGDALVDIGEGAPGRNTVGMVAWRMRMRTPEYPQGRTVIVIANDLTFQIGSFGPQEDRLFERASALARQHGWPRVYLAANSGARIGLAEEVKRVFRVAWREAEHPALGIDYLYVGDNEWHCMAKLPVVTEKVVLASGEVRHRLVSIIGKEDGLGVENLMGSALIASETSRAYEEIFTLSLVTCRSVGIGAYLVRLGQRCIQQESHPILLTGAAALNKVLGREVYTSHLQLGGTQIMHANGVTHLTTKDDFHGTLSILRWLAFVPCERDALLPVWPVSMLRDPVDRDVSFAPQPEQPYDPRWLLTGTATAGSSAAWLSGLCDRDSFIETLAGWARTVVVGRARLGGVPLGVIAVETRTVETVIEADPASAESCQQILQRAGQVWIPESAFKTAQAIRDFNVGEQLPLLILANWRGFSGGQRDMYESVLKYGAMIVDALRAYRQPCFVYLPPFAELRGGSWVVIDARIHPEMMEMYADPHSRGGIMEPEGVVEIKYRRADLLATMQRLDERYGALCAKLAQCDSDAARVAVRSSMAVRERELLPVYQQVATAFADLHDTPERMLAKGAVRAIVPWQQSRRFFGWRLRRRVYEEHWLKQLGMARSAGLAVLTGWYGERVVLPKEKNAGGWEEMMKEDERVARYFMENETAVLEERVKRVRRTTERDDIVRAVDQWSLEDKKVLLARLQSQLQGP